MSMDFYFVYIAMQIFLEKDNVYDGEIDGKVGKKTYEAIEKLLTAYGVDHKGWSRTRLRVAGEQMLYRSLDIDVGAIDGIDGHLMGYGRELFNAKLTMMFRSFMEDLYNRGVTKSVPVTPTKEAEKGEIKPFRTFPLQRRTSSYFGKVGSHQVMCDMPYPLVLAWDLNKVLHKFSCHEYVKPSLERLFQRTLDHYGHEKIKELHLDRFGGCLNVRKVRGGSSWSQHSWGIAVDLDPDRNALKMNHTVAAFAKPAYNKFWEFVYDEGAISLGKERDYDWMHFQFSRLS